MAASDLFLFVSHVAEDRAAALEVVDEIERRGVKCWIAPRDVHPGRPFDDEIVDAIEGSRAMLLIFSEHCNDSDYIRREITVAGESHKLIIPFRIEDVTPRRGLRVRLSDLHWIDAFVSRERAVDQVVHEVDPDGALEREREHQRQEDERRQREEEERRAEVALRAEEDKRARQADAAGRAEAALRQPEASHEAGSRRHAEEEAARVTTEARLTAEATRKTERGQEDERLHPLPPDKVPPPTPEDQRAHGLARRSKLVAWAIFVVVVIVGVEIANHFIIIR
ncbi:MAG TPA: toll/interleukin-1 receptor domain-containing protein [Stellaceae bacterium]|nr:toll/interleukin-1 receptor domain-containing protein [Stellaceae bacterium]